MWRIFHRPVIFMLSSFFPFSSLSKQKPLSLPLNETRLAPLISFPYHSSLSSYIVTHYITSTVEAASLNALRTNQPIKLHYGKN
jgi:hypothetical protein